MRPSDDRSGVVPLLLVSVVVVMVAAGFSRGVWAGNLHNGLLAPSLAGVGAYVLHQRPRNRCGWALLSAGVVEAVMFLGRQVGHDPGVGTSPWWGWLGVWPLVVGLALVTLSVVLFPDGHLPSPAWRWVVGIGLVMTTIIAVTSALWPVGYASAGVSTPPPFTGPADGPSVDLWSTIAHVAFSAFQLVWLAAVVARWRASGPTARRQLAVVNAAVLASLVALAVGFVGWGTPTPGLLTACLVPIAAGWAIVHRQYLATHSALHWLNRRSEDTAALPADLAAALAKTLSASRVVVWARRGDRLHAVGEWPNSAADAVAVVPLAELYDEQARTARTPDAGINHRLAVQDGRPIGAVTVQRPEPLSRHEDGLLDGFCSQATLILEHLELAAIVAGRRAGGHLDELTPRENEVLSLMAKGLSNAAICGELHLSIKTVEPAVSSIFSKLGLPPGSDSNRRVLAVLAHLEARSPTPVDG